MELPHQPRHEIKAGEGIGVMRPMPLVVLNRNPIILPHGLGDSGKRHLTDLPLALHFFAQWTRRMYLVKLVHQGLVEHGYSRTERCREETNWGCGRALLVRGLPPELRELFS